MSINIWFCDFTYTQQVFSSDVMPTSIGEIAMYCKSHISPPPATRLFKYPEKLIEDLCIEQPKAIGFGNYVWNLQLSCGFAEVIKAKFPWIMIIMCGPNFPLGQEHLKSFLRSPPAIDFFIEKERELAFCNLIQRVMELEFDIERIKEEKLGNVRAIAADGTFCAEPALKRIRDLSEILSPISAENLISSSVAN